VLGDFPKIPQAPHVQKEVGYSEVHVVAGKDTPLLTIERKGTEVCSPGNKSLRLREEPAYPRYHHDNENQNIHCDQELGGGQATGLRCALI